ncbi:Heat shock protein 70 family [Trema orientale]|uniref:Heat shock protein 70 family n=1 Tax=Trema orientale TaxID=63057 RepID=A0A2P5EEL3_TREOI|nr:Heat shock protein 70 family [Trema orientale]
MASFTSQINAFAVAAPTGCSFLGQKLGTASFVSLPGAPKGNIARRSLRVVSEKIVGVDFGTTKIDGQKVSKAVITVPWSWDDSQRRAPRDAAGSAGFKEVHLMSEPTKCCCTSIRVEEYVYLGVGGLNARNRLYPPVENVLRNAKLSVKDIDEVILVGGSTRIPAVQEFVRKITGKEPNLSINPEQIVALGAAVQTRLPTYVFCYFDHYFMAGILEGDVKDLMLKKF